MKRTRLIFPLALLAGLTALMAGSAPTKIEFPPETSAFKYAPGSEIANGQCLACHSVEYVSTQPPFPRAFWAGSVKKMQEKYGATIPQEQVEPLVDYLTQTYGVATNAASAPPQPPTDTSSAKTSPAAAADGPKLALKYGCLTCHSISMKVVGPSYHDISDKYKSDPDAKAKIAEQIHKGGSGKWGPIIMPPFPQVTEEETRVLTEWILSR